MNEYDNCMLFLLAKAYQRVYGNFKKRMQPYGLTPVQHLVILALSLEEGISAGELGKRLVLDNATLSGVLDRLSESDWVIKQASAEDKRSLKLYLTSAAKNQLDLLKKESDEANRQVLEGFSAEERMLFSRLLKDVQG